jgi:hypothetical protein
MAAKRTTPLMPRQHMGKISSARRLSCLSLPFAFACLMDPAVTAQTPYNAITTVAGDPQDASGATLSSPTSVIGDLVGKHCEPGFPALMRTAPADF